MTFTTIRFGDVEYQLTEEDVVWAARMVACEGGDARDYGAALWTMTQRLALLWPRYTSLADLVRAYSQPINPAWARGGRFCGPGGQYVDTWRCDSTTLARRDRCAGAALDELPAAVRYVVGLWAKGMLSNPVPRAVDFADPTVTAGFVRDHPGSAYVARFANHYVATAESLRWPWRYVTMGPNVWWTVISYGALGVAGGALALWAWRRRPR